MSKVFVLHENPDWTAPLFARLSERNSVFEDWNLVEGTLNLDEAPEDGVYYNRMSASSYTRDHRFSPEYAAAVLAYLEGHGRRVVNGTRALSLEINKAAQYQVLRRAGVQTPRSTIAVGKASIREAAKTFGELPFILKPNRGGKGDGVKLLNSIAELDDYLNSDGYEEPVDRISLVQQYLPSKDGAVVRAEFIGGKHFYSVKIETGGEFELCPADVCQVPDVSEGPKFTILSEQEGVPRALIQSLENTLTLSGVDVAGVEFIQHENGDWYSYDINTNTNYNDIAEQKAGLYGMDRLSSFLIDEARTGSADHLKAAS